jgi:heme-degrading monooxygenase HmoA
MYARTTQLEIDTVRVSVDAALALFEEAVLPRLQEQAGFRGVYVLTTPDGRALLVSFWATAEAADASAESGWYPEVLAEYTTLFRSPPGRERYEVRVAVPPVTAGSAR